MKFTKLRILFTSWSTCCRVANSLIESEKRVPILRKICVNSWLTCFQPSPIWVPKILCTEIWNRKIFYSKIKKVITTLLLLILDLLLRSMIQICSLNVAEPQDLLLPKFFNTKKVTLSTVHNVIYSLQALFFTFFWQDNSHSREKIIK